LSPKLIPIKIEKDISYENFELSNVIEWWRKKAINRYETLIKEKRLRTNIEIWTKDSKLDIIR
jgi:hypothetical protein